ncbi:MAG TPA: phosphatidylglycerophosphatase A [Verrucomicrobiae bacterium]|nr:phosphatidylglycerophosphatase A [Verrucomicrobiae bacterium]
MNRKIDGAEGGRDPAAGVDNADSSAERKPRLALFLATAGGLGYLPKAPGTWGSLVGVVVGYVNLWVANANLRLAPPPSGGSWSGRSAIANFFVNQIWTSVVLMVVGIWAANRASAYWRQKDPQTVVIDEVSGQSIAYLGILAAGPIVHGWIYLLVGFILFRGFDIWKPFPAKQAESLPGGWGIMADDWIAGVYSALVLLVLRRLGM